MNNLMIFEDKQVNIINEEDNVLFELYSVGQALGYEVTAKGKVYANKARIDKVVKNAGIEPVLHGVKQYLDEDMIYDFLFEAKTDKAKSFRKWVKEVLTTIRTTGAYVSDNITDEQQLLLQKYSAPRFRKNTFLTTPVEQLEAAYKECMNYHKRKVAKDKIKIRKEIVAALEERKQLALDNNSAPLALLIAEEVKKIQKDITASSNRSNGAKIGKANREIIQLQTQLSQLEPLEEEWNTIDYHGFSVNYCTIAVGDRIVASSPYNTWKRNFPVDQLPENKYNFDNPIYIWLEFDHRSKLDVANLHKTFIDKLCAHYGVTDQYVQIMRCTTRNYVDSYKEGKIHFAIREGVWQ